MKRKSLVIILALCLCISTISPFSLKTAKADEPKIVASGEAGDNIEWTLDDQGLMTFSGYGDIYDTDHKETAPWNVSDKHSIISVVIENGIKTIGDRAFEFLETLESIEIPDSITVIGANAFHGCSVLDNVDIPGSVTYLGNGAFCGSGITSIEIPPCIENIGLNTFEACANLTSVVIDSGIITLGAYSFDACINLIEVLIPDTVKSIGAYAFSSCRSLPSITIPKSVTEIGDHAFSGCSSMKKMEVDADNPVYNSRDNCNAIIETKTNSFIATCQGTKFPSDMTSISKSAFSGNWYLTHIEIPATVTYIEPGAFSGCMYLEEIIVDKDNPVYDSRDNCNAVIETATDTLISGCIATKIPDSIKAIGNYAFADFNFVFDDYGLIEIKLPSGVKSIGDYAFYYCSGLKSINLPKGLESIGEYAFFECSNLPSINLPDGLKSIGADAFSNCEKLTGVIIPDSVTNIGNGVFARCISLTDITIPSGIECIPNSAFSNCENLEKLVISSGVKTIEPYAFSNCEKLSSITIPDSVDNLDNIAFNGCNLEEIIVDKGNPVYDSRYNCNAVVESETNKLILGCKNTVIPYDVTDLDYGAFDHCNGLTSITIPSSITQINYSVFGGCENLSSIELSANIKTIDSSNFYNTSLKDVYYAGSEDDWNSINIDSGNDDLETATIHFNSVIHEPEKPAEPEEPTNPEEQTQPEEPEQQTQPDVPEQVATKDLPYSDSFATTGIFPDVNDSARAYYRPVYWAVKNNITLGYKNGYFGTTDSCTRAQFVTFIWRMAGKPSSNAKLNFSDVDTSMSAYKAIRWAVDKGIIQGYKDGTFKPNDPVLRRQVAVMLWRWFGKPNAKTQTNPFADVESTDSCYKAVLWGSEAGVVKGSKENGEQVFKPADFCQRQQIVTFLYRYARDILKQKVN